MQYLIYSDLVIRVFCLNFEQVCYKIFLSKQQFFVFCDNGLLENIL